MSFCDFSDWIKKKFASVLRVIQNNPESLKVKRGRKIDNTTQIPTERKVILH